MNTVAVIDYGMGNLRSVAQAVLSAAQHHGAKALITADPDLVRSADRVVLPGQGAMPDCMREMDARGLRQALMAAARSKPFLGICIGLQMLFERSEEKTGLPFDQASFGLTDPSQGRADRSELVFYTVYIYTV